MHALRVLILILSLLSAHDDVGVVHVLKDAILPRKHTIMPVISTYFFIDPGLLLIPNDTPQLQLKLFSRFSAEILLRQVRLGEDSLDQLHDQSKPIQEHSGTHAVFRRAQTPRVFSLLLRLKELAICLCVEHLSP